jgi:valyl-tRNA synthetase
MLGDAAVAVNPEDTRYRDAIGKAIALPLTRRNIPVIADASVDPAFGTGAVKVTPSHDFNDEAIAKRQSPVLPFFSVIAPDGTMTAEAGERYAGMDRYACRGAVIKDLRDAGFLDKQERYSHAISQCYRCKTIIEPLPALQWYVKVGPLAQKAMSAVYDRRTDFVPKAWENTYFAWMENIKDWCISRQIWWGHRIPAWFCDCGTVMVARREPEQCTKCGNISLRQEEDVLDTWFSSALWPFSTLGWPERTKELQKYYPTSVLVTGFDIIFFWVARMMMMGVQFMDDVPFRDVYIHALVRDASGQKMSKSKGNVIDPLVMMDKYGTDAFRFTLAAFAAQGRDVKFSEERVEGYRHFVNKLWNAARFILANTEGKALPALPEMQSLDVGSRWVVSRLSATTEDVRKALDEYRFNDAAGSMYHFIWHELCDWYIEMVKPVLYGDSGEKTAVQECLLYLLERTLRLLHPFMPFVTEEIWQTMPHDGLSIVTAAFPDGIPRDPVAEDQMEVLMETVTAVRTIRGELTLSPTMELKALVKTHSDRVREILKDNLLFLEKLARADIRKIGPDLEKPSGASVAVRSHVEVFVPLEGLLDIDLEIERIRKEMARIEETAGFLGKKLRNRDFLSRAPKDIIAKEKDRYDDCMNKMERIKENLQKMLDLKGKQA